MTEAERVRQVLTAIFRRRGGEGRYTRLFENLPAAQQAELRNEASVGAGELPVIGSVQASERWLLITTERIVWREKSSVHSVPVEQVHHVDPEGFNARWKTEMGTLRIETVGHETHIVSVEPGAPLCGIWNVLRNLEARNQAKQGSAG